MVTTIQLEEEIKNRLKEMKIHPRETYGEVIERLIQTGAEEELSTKTIKNIERSLEDVKSGRTYSAEEVKKKLGIK